MLILPKNYPENLAALADCIFRVLSSSVPDDCLASLVFEVIEGIRREFGGCLLYVSKGENFDRCQRNAAILEAFDGTNHAHLAKLHGLALSQIYSIVKQAKKPEAGRSRKKQDVSK